VKAFNKEVKKITGGESMHIVCDMLRGPVFPAGISVAARHGVNISAGWQLSTMVSYNSAGASTKQLTLDHTHYETLIGIEAATSLYGSVFKPTIHDEIYNFEDLPRAMAELQANQQTGIPIIRVATDMPDSVSSLIP
jgi:NADPH:quinone reductase-like Zn-dependent oxidoreductase